MAALRWRRGPLARVGLAAAVAAALLLAATASLSAYPVGKDLPTLRLDYYAAGPILAGSLDPGLGGDPPAVALVQANLVHILPNGMIAPDLATWKLSKNHLVYTFTIRKNARFSNGHYVTAQDVAFSLERDLAPSTTSPVALRYLNLVRGADAFHSGKAKQLAGVKVLGMLTVQITITRPAGYFLVALSTPVGDVLDPAVVAGKPIGVLDPATGLSAGNYLTNTCIGNQGAGPFEFVCHDRSSTLHSFYAGDIPTYTLVPNSYYYGRKPLIRLELPAFGPFDNYKTSYKRYLAGKLDASGIPFAYLRQWQGKREFHQFPSSAIDFLVPNTHLAPFDNVHCRLAVAYAIDRKTLADSVLVGAEWSAYGVLPKGMLGHYTGKDDPHYSLKRARAELAQCPGRTTPIRLKFPGGVWGIKAMPFVGTELRAIGMNVRLVPLYEFGPTLSQPLDKTGTQIALNPWVPDYPDAQDYLFSLLHSGAPANLGAWQDTTYDRLIDRGDALSNPEEREKLYIEAQQIALSQGAIVMLMQAKGLELVKPYVHGLVGTAVYTEVYRDLRPYLVPKDDDWANVSISEH